MKQFNGFDCRARKVLQCLKLQNLAKSVLHSFFMEGIQVAHYGRNTGCTLWEEYRLHRVC